MEKRKFYNTGDAKGFTKQKFFEAVVDMCNGEDVDVDLVRAAAPTRLPARRRMLCSPTMPTPCVPLSCL